MWKKYKSVIIFMLMASSLLLFIPFRNEDCFSQQEFRKHKYSGIVNQKFIDKSDHSIPKIEIRGIDSAFLDTIYLNGELLGIFNLVKNTDTILKPSSSNSFFVKRNGVFELLGDVDFGCNNADKK